MYIRVIRLFSAEDLHGPPLYQPQKYFKSLEIVEAFLLPYSATQAWSSLNPLTCNIFQCTRSPSLLLHAQEVITPFQRLEQEPCRCFLTLHAEPGGLGWHHVNESTECSRMAWVRKTIFRLHLGEFLLSQKVQEGIYLQCRMDTGDTHPISNSITNLWPQTQQLTLLPDLGHTENNIWACSLLHSLCLSTGETEIRNLAAHCQAHCV